MATVDERTSLVGQRMGTREMQLLLLAKSGVAQVYEIELQCIRRYV